MIKMLNLVLSSVVIVTLINSAELPITNQEYVQLPSIYELDDFDRCMLLENEALYCTFTVKTEINIFSTEEARLIKTLMKNQNYFKHDELKRGLCLPLSCGNVNESTVLHYNDEVFIKEKISECYKKKMKELYDLTGSITDVHCVVQNSERTVSSYAKFARLVFALYICLIVFCTIFEGIARYKSKEEYKIIFSSKVPKFIACFSLANSWHRLIEIDNSDDGKALSGIQGIRFITMIQVMAVHNIFLHSIAPTANTMYLENAVLNYGVQIYTVWASFVVQIFFVIGAWLQSYHFFLLMENVSKFEWKFVWVSFLNRVLRLTPCLMVLLIFITSWLQYAGTGPYWHRFVGKEIENCKENWWSNLLFFNNYVDNNKMCFIHLWYLATDVQLYVIHLILLSFIWRFRTRAKLILCSFIIIAFAVTGYITYYYDYDMIPHRKLSENNVREHDPHAQHTYFNTLANLGAGTIGLMLGYFYYKCRGNKRISESKIITTTWWIVSWALVIAPILIGTIQLQDWYSKNRYLSAIYAGLGKNLYALGVGLLIFGTSLELGWIIKWTLQWKPLYVLGKLGFCGYITHQIYFVAKTGSLKHLLYMDAYTLMIDMFGSITISIFLAALMCVFVELPFGALQKLIIPQLSTFHKKKIDQ